MTRVEHLLNIYFSTDDKTLKDFMKIIDEENNDKKSLLTEINCILIWLNHEV